VFWQFSPFLVAQELAPGLLHLIRGSGDAAKLPMMYRAAPKRIFQPKMSVVLRLRNLALWLYVEQSVSGTNMMPKITIIPDWLDS